MNGVEEILALFEDVKAELREGPLSLERSRHYYMRALASGVSDSICHETAAALANCMITTHGMRDIVKIEFMIQLLNPTGHVKEPEVKPKSRSRKKS